MTPRLMVDPAAMPEDVRVGTQVITPQLAVQMLERNTFNRNLRPATVDAYAADLEAGNWHFNGDPIRFAKDGTLLDGQHRLHAIVQAGIPVRMVVMRGLAPQQQHTMDTGLKRSLGDALRLRGEKNANQLATVVRSIGTWELLTKDDRRGLVSTSSLLQFLDDNSWIREGVEVCRAVYLSTRLSMAVSAPLWYRFTLIAPDDTRAFFKRLASDEGHFNGEPIYRLRRVLMTDHNGLPVKQQVPARQATGLVIKAWNKYRAGEECHSLTFTAGGANPEPMPEPR